MYRILGKEVEYERKQIKGWPRKERNNCVTFEVFTSVTMKNIVLWDMLPCGSYKNRRFGGTYRHHQGDKNQPARNDFSSEEFRLLGCYTAWLL
jgi:hypothetical protein